MLGLLQWGCSTGAVLEDDPKALYEDAESDIESDRYQLALDKLRTVKNKFPYSKYSIKAKLRMADVYYLQENYLEAAALYEVFKDLHPKHHKVPYALYRIGESYLNDVPDLVARDLTSAHKAIEAYSNFLYQFPNDENSKQAREKINILKNKLAEKEMYIGKFYYTWEKYLSAKNRFEKVIALYPETSQAEDAKKRLAKTEKKLSEEESDD